MDSESSAKTSKKDESIEDTVPSVDPNDPLVFETENTQSTEVPKSNPDADLYIDKLTKETNIPESNLNASLKIEEEPQRHGAYENKSNKNLFVAGGIGAGIILLSIAGFIVLGFRSSQEKKMVDISIEQPKISLKEEEEPVIDRSEWAIEVLNGSGVSGAAKELAEKLEQLGYKILKTGNASKSNYKNTEVYISKDFVDKSDLLFEDLKDEINVSTVSGELEDSTASARIIIGKK